MAASPRPIKLSGTRNAFINSVCFRNTTNSCFYVGLAHTHECPFIAAKPAAVTRYFRAKLASSFLPEWVNDSVGSWARNVN